MTIFLSILLAAVVLVGLLLAMTTSDRQSSAAWASTTKWLGIILVIGLAALAVADRFTP